MTERGTAQRMKAGLPLGRDAASVRQRIEALERLLERSFTVPGLKLPVGLDAVAGMVPVAGDLIAGLIGAYVVWEARNLGMPKWRLALMMTRIGLDTLLGSIPVAGDLFDVLYRSNSRNLNTIRKYLDRHHPGTKVIDL